MEALDHFLSAFSLDPSFADAFAQQACCRTTLFVFDFPGTDATLHLAEMLGEKAIEPNRESALD